MSTVTPYSQQDIYNFGDEIPGYVSLVYEPKIWYDQSKSVNGGTWDIFNELGVSESLILGDTLDDLFTFEETLEEICKFFNLHIIQLGYDFYIFDWETAKSGNSVTWVNKARIRQCWLAKLTTLTIAHRFHSVNATTRLS